MQRTCDLHTHSNFSDGTLSPTQLIAEAEKVGLSAIALTDHNTVAGLPEFLNAGKNSTVETVAGIEFSTEYLDAELHIVCLFLKPEHYGPITELTDAMMKRKQQSNIDLIARLNEAGYHINYQTIKNSMPEGEPNRALIAAELTRLGYTASIKEAFKTLLSTKCGYYTPPKRIDVFELIEWMHGMGVVTIFAHPYLSIQNEQELQPFLNKAVECGLQGMETRYPLFSQEQTAHLEKLAHQYGLAESGGSDFHGENKPDIRLGTGKGTLNVPIAFLDNLRSRMR